MGINLSTLNKAQREAVESIDGAVLILAGAGTGKTRVITYRIAYMIREKIPARNILAVTFTNKAAREMKERIYELVDKDIAKDLTISTFHSLGVRILREDGKKIGINRNFLIYTQSDQESLIKIIFKEKYKVESVEIKTVREILHIISEAKSNKITPEVFKENARSDSLLLASSIYDYYDKYLRIFGAVDFNDLILQPVNLFEQFEDVRKKYQNRYKYIMIDEYQDTNNLQFQFIDYIAGFYPNICVVGDDDQSIYGFRGANVDNILEFNKQYDNVKSIKLEQNYRSTENILLAANSVIKQNNKRMNKSLFSELGEGSPIIHYIIGNPQEEADQIVQKIAQYKLNKIKNKDIAVLYRSNHQSREIETKFKNARIEYKVVGGTDFYSRKEIRDILSYLIILVHKNDEINLRRVLNYPPRGIGSSSVAEINRYAQTHKISFFKALQSSDKIIKRAKTLKGINSFLAIVDKYSKLLNEVLTKESLYSFIEEIGIVTQIISENKDMKTAQMKKRNIITLLDNLVEYNYTLKDFIMKFALRDEADKKDEDKDEVTLLSIHASKGLEFDYLFLVGFNEGIIPHQRSIETGNRSDIEEERRLCYVAITRARKQLVISSIASRKMNGKRYDFEFSRFLSDIPPEIIKTINFRKNESELTDEEGQNNFFEAMDGLFD